MPHKKAKSSGSTRYNTVPFLNGPFQSLRDGSDPWVFLVLALVAYLVTLQPWAFPGTPATLAAAATGAIPRTSPANGVWNALMRLVAGSGTQMVWRMNIASAVFGALSVCLCNSVVRRLLTLAVEPTQIGHLPAARHAEGTEVAARACRLGAAAASLALAFCLPFWLAATRVYPHTFNIFWILLSARLLLQFSRSRHLVWAVLWAGVHAAGMTQTGLFVDFLPFFLAYFLYVLWADSRIRASRCLVATAATAVLVAVVVLLIDAQTFHVSDGAAAAGGYRTLWQCIRRIVSGVSNGAKGFLGGRGWAIPLGLCVAPFLASLLAARRAINGETTWSFLGLHTVITVITVLVVIDFRASPWRYFGTDNFTIVPYLLSAGAFGYATAYLYLLPFNLWATAESETRQRRATWLRVTLGIAMLAVAVVAAVLHYPQLSTAHARQFRLYADHMVDSLDGRTWLVTDGALDELLLIRARERGVELHCINPSPQSLRLARRSFKDPALRNAATMGLVQLLQEWLSRPEDAVANLALARFPDLWGLGGLQMRPNRLLFLGMPPEDAASMDIATAVAAHEQVWERFGAEFSKMSVSTQADWDQRLPYDAPTLVERFYRDYVLRPQLSFVGNDLGYLISMLSRDESLPSKRREELAKIAYEIYGKVHAFDPDNVSATLNWAGKVFEHEPREQQGEAREALNRLNRDLDKNLTAMQKVWSLARNYGYVEDPAFFAILGWTWATTGQPNLAMQALSAAEATLPDQVRTSAKTDMARLHMAASHPDESEKLYFEILVEDPGNINALMGLVRIFAFRGDTERAREFLKRAETAGAPAGDIQRSAAVLYAVEGDQVRARAVLQQVVDTDPKDLAAWSMLATLLYEQKDEYALDMAAKSLASKAGEEAYETLLVKAMLEELLGDQVGDNSENTHYREARDLYANASRLPPGKSVMLLNRVLALDYRILDKVAAREHAIQILGMDLHAGFANYILGSLAIDAGDFPGAEVYLRRAVEREPTLANLNDLADVLCHLEQYDEAELRIQQAFQQDGADQVYALWDTQGLVYLARGHLEEAEAAFAQALALYGEDLRVHLHLAELYYKQGRTDQAAETIRAIARQADTLPPADRKQFEELHMKVLGVRFSKRNYKGQ